MKLAFTCIYDTRSLMKLQANLLLARVCAHPQQRTALEADADSFLFAQLQYLDSLDCLELYEMLNPAFSKELLSMIYYDSWSIPNGIDNLPSSCTVHLDFHSLSGSSWGAGGASAAADELASLLFLPGVQSFFIPDMFLNLALVCFSTVCFSTPKIAPADVGLCKPDSRTIDLIKGSSSILPSYGQTTITAKNSHCKEQWLQRPITAKNKNTHRKERSLQRTVTAKNTHCKELQLAVFQGRLARKLRFHIVNLLLFQEVSCEKVLFSHRQTAVFKGSYARKLRFHNCTLQFFDGNLAPKLRLHHFNLQFFKCRMPPSLHLRPILGVSCRPLYQRTWFWLRCHESFRLFATLSPCSSLWMISPESVWAQGSSNSGGL